MAAIEYNQDKQIVSVTNVDDIRRYRPDLTNEEAMRLLVENERVMNERYGEKGFDWEDLQEFADMQFPERQVFCLMAPADGDQAVIAAGKLSLLSGGFELISGVAGSEYARHVFFVPSGGALPSSLELTIAEPIASFDGVAINSVPFKKGGLRANMLEIYQHMPALLQARADQLDSLKYVTSIDLLKTMVRNGGRIFSEIGTDDHYFIEYEAGEQVFYVRDHALSADSKFAVDEIAASKIGKAIESGCLKCWDDMGMLLERPAAHNQEFKPKP